MSDLRTEIREAKDASELTWDDVRLRSGVGCDQTSLLRKISGEQPLTFDDAVRVAGALGVKTAAVVRAQALASAIGATLTWEPVRADIPSAPRSRRRRAA